MTTPAPTAVQGQTVIVTVPAVLNRSTCTTAPLLVLNVNDDGTVDGLVTYQTGNTRLLANQPWTPVTTPTD